MPSGRTHDRITLLCLPLVAASTLAITQQYGPTLWVSAGFLLGGMMLGPDLDIHSVQYKRWGWLRWIWLPYRSLMKHRSPYSHGPIIGTVVRVLYLMAWLAGLGLVAIALANQVGDFGWTWQGLGQVVERSLFPFLAEWIAVGIGLELGASSHYIADWVVSSQKRSKSQKSQKSRKSSKTRPKRSPRQRP